MQQVQLYAPLRLICLSACLPVCLFFSLPTCQLANQPTCLPVCVRMCRLSRLGLSNAFPQTSQGSKQRSLRPIRVRCGVRWWSRITFSQFVEFITSLTGSFNDITEPDRSLDIDLCSSSLLETGETGNEMRCSREAERSIGESNKRLIQIHRFTY